MWVGIIPNKSHRIAAWLCHRHIQGRILVPDSTSSAKPLGVMGREM